MMVLVFYVEVVGYGFGFKVLFGASFHFEDLLICAYFVCPSLVSYFKALMFFLEIY